MRVNELASKDIAEDNKDKTVAKTSDPSDVDNITTEFIKHYEHDPMGVFMHAKSSYLDAVEKARHFSRAAAQLRASHANMSKEEFQDTIMKYFGKHLQNNGFPQHASEDWGKSEHELVKELMNLDKQGVAEDTPNKSQSVSPKINIQSHRVGNTMWIDYFEVKPRNQGFGTKAYMQWEKNLPSDIKTVRLVASDAGEGPSHEFWDRIGFDYAYDDDDGPIEMVKTVERQDVTEGEGGQISKSKALNALRKQLMNEYPYMKCANLQEFKQRLQWLSEGMLKNHLTNDKNYKINTEEIALYQEYRKKREQIQQGLQDVAEGSSNKKLKEIDFSSSLGELAMSQENLINNASIDGSIGTRKVYIFKSGPNKIYFFIEGNKIAALVYLYQDRVMGMKNFSTNSGLIYNLFQYIINIKRQRVRITPEDKLTTDGIKWIIGQIRRSDGFKITDSNGNNIDPKSLYDEWETARISGINGPTEIIIGESKNSKQIRENETRLMPMDIFGATLKKIDEKIDQRIIMNNILENNKDHSSNKTLNEKFKSQQQAKLMYAVAGDKDVSKKTGVSQKVAKEFIKKSHGQKVSKLPTKVKKTTEEVQTGGSKGLPFPGTYEQETNKFLYKGQRRTPTP